VRRGNENTRVFVSEYYSRLRTRRDGSVRVRTRRDGLIMVQVQPNTVVGIP
jgi:hypothetical protein